MVIPTAEFKFTRAEAKVAYQHHLIKLIKDPFYRSGLLHFSDQMTDATRIQQWFKVLEEVLLSKNGNYYFKWMTDLFEAFETSTYNHIAENILFFWAYYLKWNFTRISTIDVNTIRFYASRSLISDNKMVRFAAIIVLRNIPDRETLQIFGKRLGKEEQSTLKFELRIATTSVLDKVYGKEKKLCDLVKLAQGE